jgi:hypothetical protein
MYMHIYHTKVLQIIIHHTAQVQPDIAPIADQLQGWKANLKTKAGRMVRLHTRNTHRCACMPPMNNRSPLPPHPHVCACVVQQQEKAGTLMSDRSTDSSC